MYITRISFLSFFSLIVTLSVWVECSLFHKGYRTHKNIPRSNIAPPINQAALAELKFLDHSLSKCGPIDIRELTIEKAQKYFSENVLSSLDLTKCYLKRIKMMDVHLKSVIEVNPEAEVIASNADAMRQFSLKLYPKLSFPLLGIPILIKDNIGTADSMQTTTGAIALELVRPKKDAEVVKRLRAAGAVILGKTNPSEWAYFRGDDEPSGWSGRGGQTISPYNVSESPSGSSTGSAVAVSANLALCALGTETDGSIISPSSRNSLVGLRTTLHIVPTDGVIPIGFSQDVVGPMARTARDAAILLETISSRDLLHGHCDRDSQSCVSVKEKHWTIGLLRETFWNRTNPTINSSIPAFEKSLNVLRQTGFATIIDPVTGNFTLLSNVTADSEFIVLSHEFKYGVDKYLNDEVVHLEFLLGRKIKSLADVVKFNKEFPPPEKYNQKTLIAAEATDGLLNSTYIKAREENRQFSKRFLDEVFDNYGLNVIASPCFTGTNDSATDLTLYSFGDMAGYPSISVPVGLDEVGMPFGLCFLGKANSDFQLLKLASVFEKELKMIKTTPKLGRSTPRFA